MKERKWPLAKALGIIFGSSLLTVGCFMIALKSVGYRKAYLRSDPRFTIEDIIQSTPSGETLQTSYLAQLLDLSIDKPMNIYRFDISKGEQKLQTSPVIKEAHISKYPPNALSIRYVLRTPIMQLADVENAAIDEEGVVFPLKPFFTPKRLPALYLGEKNIAFGRRLSCGNYRVAFDILTLCFEKLALTKLFIHTIDLNSFAASSLGKRSIAVRIDNPHSIHYIRLPAEGYDRALGNYFEMHGELLYQEQDQMGAGEKHTCDTPSIQCKIIDLRLPNLGYIEEVITHDL